MFKYLFYTILTGVICVLLYFGFHSYRVHAQNNHEMAQYTQVTPYTADLGNVLVIYYSLDGHTKDIAQRIAAQAKGDLYELTTFQTYDKPFSYYISKKQLQEKSYPTLEKIPDLANYHTIFVGGPVWWHTMAAPLYSLLNHIDFSGKRVVPFSTQGSNYGTFFTDFAAHAKNANILEGESFNNMPPEYDELVNNKIIIWLNKLSYPEDF